jgi:2-amino-4-hydroxy-6-hydroxymethyldihydropteridine diphosphokinase
MKAVIALGSNLGDRFQYLQMAIQEINTLVDTKVTKISSVYETDPIGGPVQKNYLNAILEIETNIRAEELMTKISLIESILGRERTIHWGPRTIDLDLIWFDNLKIKSKNLILPHPRASQRCFVLKPWLEIDAAANLNGIGEVKNLILDLDCQGIEIFPGKLSNI